MSYVIAIFEVLLKLEEAFCIENNKIISFLFQLWNTLRVYVPTQVFRNYGTALMWVFYGPMSNNKMKKLQERCL